MAAKISRAADVVLQLFDKEAKPLSASRIAGKLNMDPSTVSNIIVELSKEELIDRVNATDYKISFLGISYLNPAEEEDDNKPLSDEEMDRLLDGAAEEVAESSGDMPAFQKNQADEWVQAEAAANLTAFDSDIQSAILKEFDEMVSKMKAPVIDRLELKIQTLGLLAGIAGPAMAKVLADICDDLTKISEK